MRSHCIKQQREAREKLRSYQPEGVPEEVVDDIKSNGKKKWPRDFQMRYNFVKQQVESYLELKSKSPKNHTMYDIGEKPGIGRYCCTNCGWSVRLDDSDDHLPPCGNCDKGQDTKYRDC